MSWFIRFVSGLSILVIILVWGILSISNDKLLPLPQSIMTVGFVLFAGEKGIEFVRDRLGRNDKSNKEVKNVNSGT